MKIRYKIGLAMAGIALGSALIATGLFALGVTLPIITVSVFSAAAMGFTGLMGGLGIKSFFTSRKKAPVVESQKVELTYAKALENFLAEDKKSAAEQEFCELFQLPTDNKPAVNLVQAVKNFKQTPKSEKEQQLLEQLEAPQIEAVEPVFSL